MTQLNPAVRVFEENNGAHTVKYTIVDTDGVKYEQDKVELANTSDECMPGVIANVTLKEVSGSTNTFEGEFEMSKEYVLDEKNPYLQVNIYKNGEGQPVYRGGSIIRDQIIRG